VSEHPRKLGTVQGVDMDTGEVLKTEHNAMTLLLCAPDMCQECATEHPWDQPHNQQSLYYQVCFHITHGRWPKWSNAMAHCTPEVQAHWRRLLVRLMTAHGLEIPADLREEKPAGR
jgi:hypothetical protein